MTAYDPLHGPDEVPSTPADLDVELRVTRGYLAEVATANIHDHTAMVKVATGLDYRLRALVAAVEAERDAR